MIILITQIISETFIRFYFILKNSPLYLNPKQRKTNQNATYIFCKYDDGNDMYHDVYVSSLCIAER
jgi:hypothetical protein